MQILVTGGAGYIGSHTCVELLEAGHDVVVVDNLSNSNAISLARVETLTQCRAPLEVADIRDRDALNRVFAANRFDAVIHFAGLKAVGESTAKPTTYYDNNVAGTLVLLEVMAAHDVRSLVFSSSATVYGDPATVPITEDFPLTATNPYGWSKLMIEQILRDVQAADSRWSVTLLRYFNPVGAHGSGTIGEDPNGIPNNLLPYISQVAIGKRPYLSVFGDDYPTPDGTGVRDYIHVVDLAKGHLAALDTHGNEAGVHTYNLGTGQGVSVLEMVAAFEKACGRPLSYQIAPRRPGDIAECYADPSAAQKGLGWRATHSLQDAVADAWRWQSQNPEGFPDP